MTQQTFPATVITLSSGLRLVYMKDNSEVEYFGTIVNSGSRDDPGDRFGLAHFVEHVIFKGTARRRSWHIINRMESCGGELNAYTTKETTVVYTIFPRGNFSRASDLIGDLLCNSIFPSRELEKEREVVADEIDQYRDMPSEAVFDDFEDLLFKDSGLGHNILGSADDLRAFDSELCREYLTANFTVDNMVVFYSGSLSAAVVSRSVERNFSSLPSACRRKKRIVPPPAAFFDCAVNLGNHQANTVTGSRIPSMYSPERHSFALLANILGGPGMNSLLNVELRERRGLVYAVEASTAFLTDTGLLTIYFGCDHDDTRRCRRITAGVIRKIADNGVSDRFLSTARRQFIGQQTLAADIRENAIISVARGVLYFGRVSSRKERVECIEAVSANDLRRCAATLLAEGLSTLTLE